MSTPTFRVGNTTVRNVIAQTRTGSPERVVMAGAHLDSVPEGPGINDNGSGVAALLEIAMRLGGSPQVSNAVRASPERVMACRAMAARSTGLCSVRRWSLLASTSRPSMRRS